MTLPTTTTSAVRRLHPLSPLLRGFRMVIVIVAAFSWQGLDRGVRWWLIGVGAIAVLTVIGSVISYLRTGYEIVGRELRIHEGVVSRRTRAIPLERLQSVEIVRPLVARLLGLAVLRLEVVGGNRTEAPLSYLAEADAVALRRDLLSLARPVAAAPAPAALPDLAAAPVEAQPAERPIHQINNRDLFLSQVMRPQWIFLPLAVVAQLGWAISDLQVSFIAIASTVTALFGILLAPVRSLLGDWSFRLAASADGLRIRRGLTETSNQTVPLNRVQAVVVQWPLLWRWRGWARARLQIAGVSGQGGQGGQGSDPRSSLLPVGTIDVVEQVVAEALPGFALTAVAVHPVPPQARRRAPFTWRVLGFQLTDSAFVARSGLLTRQLTIVPYARIQSVRVTQGPWQRRLGLASVWVDPAGGPLADSRAVAAHRAVDEAVALADDLTHRARAARHPTPPA